MFRRRWSLTSKVLAALGVLLGALAFVMMRGYQDRVEALHPAVGPRVTVEVAAIDIRRGAQLTDDMLRTTSVPEVFVPPGAVRDGAALIGRVLVADIDAGEILTRSRLAEPRVGPIAALVPEGLRAVIIPAGIPPDAIRPGDKIEVVATYGGGQPHTELVASGVEVLLVLAGTGDASGGLDGTASSGGGDIQLVLLVDPTAAEQLAYARAFAQLQVAILGPDTATGSS
jgi:Flp pilus assembly protein CpaB